MHCKNINVTENTFNKKKKKKKNKKQQHKEL